MSEKEYKEACEKARKLENIKKPLSQKRQDLLTKYWFQIHHYKKGIR